MALPVHTAHNPARLQYLRGARLRLVSALYQNCLNQNQPQQHKSLSIRLCVSVPRCACRRPVGPFSVSSAALPPLHKLARAEGPSFPRWHLPPDDPSSNLHFNSSRTCLHPSPTPTRSFTQGLYDLGQCANTAAPKIRVGLFSDPKRGGRARLGGAEAPPRNKRHLSCIAAAAGAHVIRALPLLQPLLLSQRGLTRPPLVRPESDCVRHLPSPFLPLQSSCFFFLSLPLPSPLLTPCSSSPPPRRLRRRCCPLARTPPMFPQRSGTVTPQCRSRLRPSASSAAGRTCPRLPRGCRLTPRQWSGGPTLRPTSSIRLFSWTGMQSTGAQSHCLPNRLRSSRHCRALQQSACYAG